MSGQIRADKDSDAPSGSGDIRTGIGPDGKPIKRAHEDIPVVSLRDAGKFVQAVDDSFLEVGK